MQDIIDTAVAAGTFQTLTVALLTAGLTSPLKAKGPLTVFAPRDEAFRKLPAATVEALFADVPRLASILAYHVVEGRVMASDLMLLAGDSIDTLNGADIDISTDRGVVLNGASTVVQSDIECTNGVIHVIDVVLLPA